jgi:hypothetical protein
MNRLSLIFPRLARATATRPAARNLVSKSRKVSGSDSHGSAGPYDAPHHPTYAEEAHLFNINLAQPYKAEGWEAITTLTYLATFGVFVAIFATKEVDDFSVSVQHK